MNEGLILPSIRAPTAFLREEFQYSEVEFRDGFGIIPNQCAEASFGTPKQGESHGNQLSGNQQRPFGAH
jgi:hypothetical protein